MKPRKSEILSAGVAACGIPCPGVPPCVARENLPRPKLLPLSRRRMRGSIKLSSMWRAVRLTVMWLLAVALPLQSLSAATMLSCGGGQHDHGLSQVLGHSHTPSVGHTHAHVADAGQHASSDADHSHPDKSTFGKGGAHKCSICASCCTSAVVPTQASVFDPIKPTYSFALLVAPPLTAVVTEGLERPPRLFLA